MCPRLYSSHSYPQLKAICSPNWFSFSKHSQCTQSVVLPLLASALFDQTSSKISSKMHAREAWCKQLQAVAVSVNVRVPLSSQQPEENGKKTQVKPEAVTVGNIKEALRQEFSGVDRALKLVAFRGRYRLWVLKTHTERPNKHNNLHFVWIFRHRCLWHRDSSWCNWAQDVPVPRLGKRWSYSAKLALASPGKTRIREY